MRAELRIVIGKTQDDRDDHRRQHEDEIERHRRKDEEVAGPGLMRSEI